MSLLMCMWNGKREKRSFGWNRYAWREAGVWAGWRLDVSKDRLKKTRSRY
jgi:hypothetical protein